MTEADAHHLPDRVTVAGRSDSPMAQPVAADKRAGTVNRARRAGRTERGRSPASSNQQMIAWAAALAGCRARAGVAVRGTLGPAQADHAWQANLSLHVRAGELCQESRVRQIDKPMWSASRWLASLPTGAPSAVSVANLKSALMANRTPHPLG